MQRLMQRVQASDLFRFRVPVFPIYLSDRFSVVLIFNPASVADHDSASESAPFALQFALQAVRCEHLAEALPRNSH